MRRWTEERSDGGGGDVSFQSSVFTFPFLSFRFPKAPSLGVGGPYPPSFGIEVVDSVAYALAGSKRHTLVAQGDGPLRGINTNCFSTKVT